MQSPTQRIARRAWLGFLMFCLFWNASKLFQITPTWTEPYIAGWDGNGYYAWARSLAFDGDVDFRNDYEHIAKWPGGGSTSRDYAAYLAKGETTPTGRVPNKYGIGCGLLSLPAIYAVRLGRAVVGNPTDPFSPDYVMAFLATSILAGFMGLFIGYRILLRRFRPSVALAAMAVGALGTNLGYYIWIEPAMSHSMAFGFVTLFVYCALAWHDAVWTPGRRAAWLALAMGVCLGVSCMIRCTSALIAILPVVLWWRGLVTHGRTDDNIANSSVAASFLPAALGALIGFLPQMIAWKALYGSWLTYSYGNEVLHPLPIFLPQILFGKSGLFLITPLALIGVGGLAAAAWRRDALALAGAAVMAGVAYLYGSWDTYSLGASFGMRGFADWSFFIMFGLAWAMDYALKCPKSNPARWLIPLAIGAFTAQNLFFMATSKNVASMAGPGKRSRSARTADITSPGVVHVTRPDTAGQQRGLSAGVSITDEATTKQHV